MTDHLTNLVTKAKACMALYGPKPPWRIVGMSSIDTQNGEACLTVEGSWINDDVRQRICESVNLLPELVGEIERLKDIEDTLSKWYRIEARIHQALVERFGSEAFLEAVHLACPDLAAHNPLLGSQSEPSSEP